MELLKTKVGQAACCLLCAVVALRFGFDLEGSEFSGRTVTGPLLGMLNIGAVLFLSALLLTFFIRRIAASIALLACLLCLPLYLLFTAPGPFRRVVGGEWKTWLVSNFVWDWWSVAGIVTCALAACACFRSFARTGAKS
jgi:hypothetical protein